MEGLRHAPGLGFFQVPTLLWLSSSDAMLHLLCAIAFFSGAALVAGFAPRVACLTLWASWLSLVQIGHPFLAFQWDVLLIESAFLAAFLAPSGLRPAIRRVESDRSANSTLTFFSSGCSFSGMPQYGQKAWLRAWARRQAGHRGAGMGHAL